MAPGRKRGANKVKAKSQLSLGDLVLAKVKGFPAWPAKVFTSELKNKLSARCQGKSKYFAQAVKEISSAFQGLQKEKSSGLLGIDRSALGCEAASVDGIADEILELNDGMGTSEPKRETWDEEGDFRSKLKHCSHRQGQTEYEDIKTSISSDVNDNSSLVMSSEKKIKISNDEQPELKLSTSCLDNHSYVMLKESGDVHENISCTKNPGNAEGAWMNGHQSKSMATETKRKPEGAIEGHKSSGSAACGLPDNGKKLKDGAQEKNTSGGTIRGFSTDASKSDSEIRTGQKAKELQKGKNSLMVPDSMHENVSNCVGEISDKKKRAQSGLGKTSETLHSAKKPKCLVLGDATAKESITKNMKNVSPSSNAVTQSKSHEKREILLALRAQTGITKSDGSAQVAKNKSDISSRTRKVKSDISIQMCKTKADAPTPASKVKSDASVQMGKANSDIPAQTGKGKPDVSSDEAVLPVSKRHRRAMEAMSDSAFLNSNDKTEKVSVELKKDSSNNARVPVNQLPKRRRAVCLYDDDDEEEDPKTPIHGGSTKSVRASSAVFGTSTRTDSHIGSTVNYQHRSSINVQQSVEDSTRFEHNSSKELSSQLHDESLSPCRPKSVKRPDTQDFVSPGKLAAEQPPLEQPKASKPLVKASSGGTLKKVQSGSGKVLGLVSDSLNTSQNHVGSQRNRPGMSGERQKNTPKGQMGDPAVLTEPSTDQEGVTEDRGSSLVDSKTPDSGRSPSHSPVQPFLSSSSTVLQTDLQGFQHRVVSPSTHGHQSASCNQVDTEEFEEQRVSSSHRAVGGSLSGGTEAAVARDAFEGMIETLSRTKESIGRATRLAIDCAKYGIANEGLLELQYVPTVQAALPRLLVLLLLQELVLEKTSSVSQGKVLRLWLERKIIPESVLRQYMDDIGVSNDDSSAGFSLRRPSRAERAVDDP
ncbi:hypothetical protein GH714_037674 [Hevea brasiliensis]|uniref:PWWP domain-containing protein n=1 Tax=Hevea brasiliensis TaxID=3981 RepID=A0A6A6LR01_HEVBR|nr:hypothetical protein GH714_037674 [Hevea brasiliensis]